MRFHSTAATWSRVRTEWINTPLGGLRQGGVLIRHVQIALYPLLGTRTMARPPLFMLPAHSEACAPAP